MPVDVEKLTKILKMEATDGYLDRKVLRGLAAFIGNWTSASLKASPSALEARLIEQVAERLTDYASLPPVARATAIQDILVAIIQVEGRRSKVEGQEKLSAVSRQGSANNLKRQETELQGQNPKSEVQNQDNSVLSPQSSVLKTPTIAPTPNPQPAASKLDAPLTSVKGIGETYARLLTFLDLHTVQQALYYLPFRHEDFSSFKKISELMYGRTESIIADVVDKQFIRMGRSGKEMIEVALSDETGMVRANFFNRKQVASLKIGMKVVISGRVEAFNGHIIFKSPTYEQADKDLVHTGRLVPIYSTVGPLKVTTLRGLLKKVVDTYASAVPEHLPATIRQRHHLQDLSLALKNYHFPPDKEDLERARRRLAFDEFFMIQLGVLLKRREWQEEQPAPPLLVDPVLLAEWYNALPFAMTGDQRHATDDILGDMAKAKPMRRMVQGDVGSGKTAVAATALMVALANGYQGVMMAPTQILAEQHYNNLSRMFKNFGEKSGDKLEHPPVVALLSSAVKKKERELTYQRIAAGEVDIIVGTHAVIQEGVQFARLGLVITDEQHRFGVMQRSTLRDKGQRINPHVLTMTATPIPRSLNLTVYGDLDISLIREMPPGRQPIKTRWVMPDERERAYRFIRKEIEKGRQAFIICPLVEESDKIEAKAAVEEHARLQKEVFPDLKLGLLHGRMKPAEKDKIMLDFREKTFDMLVATSVIEVGIDIPNASVILIEGADRFGLSQLHQFRGRVGRGQHASFCLLLAGEELSQVGQQRLKIIEETNDGFVLAEEDLKLRGPGEFFGTRQSGVPDLRVAGIYDTALLETARTEASAIFQHDPTLETYPLLAKKVSQLWNTAGDLS